MPNGQSAEAGLLNIAPHGRLLADFSTDRTPLELDLVDPLSGHTAQFAENDLLRISTLGFPDPAETMASATIAHEFWLPGGLPMAVPCDVWLKVTAVSDEGSHFRYAVQVQENSGPDCRFPAGSAIVSYGQVTDERILLTAAEDGTTYVDLYRTGQAPWQQRESLVRLGRLDDLAVAGEKQLGLAIGSTLQQPENPYIIASTQHLKLSQVDLEVGDGQATTVRIGNDGTLQAGVDVDDSEMAGLVYEPQQNVLSLHGDLNIGGETVFAGPISIIEDEVTRVCITPSGDVKVGSNVDEQEQTRLHFSAAEGVLTLRGTWQFSNGERPTVGVSNNGDVQIGADITAAETTGFDFRAEANELLLRSDLQLQGAAVSHGTLQFRNNGHATAAISETGDLRLGPDISSADGTGFHFQSDIGRFDLSAELHLMNDSYVNGDLRLEGDAAVRAGDGVRFDRDGLQMRLEPGENNSIKVFGVGRAALINAFQTADSIQQLDVLAYYSRGLPALHGSLLLGVADAAGGEPDTFLRMTRYSTGVRDIEMDASYVNVRCDHIQLNGDASVRGNFDYSGTGGAERVFRLRNLPISPAGLPSGAIWNHRGTLKVVH